MRFNYKKLKASREAKKYSATDLAYHLRKQKMTITAQTILRWENGDACPRADYLAKVCLILNESPMTFFN